MRPPLFVLIPGTICVAVATGCGGGGVEFTETRRINERLSKAEILQYVRIARALDEEGLAVLGSVYADPPLWSASRTLPVSELLDEERWSFENRWEVARLAERLPHERRFERVLKREGLTREQFVGLALAIGCAVSRGTLRPDQDLEELIERGQQVLDRLRRNTRSFATHSQSARHFVLQQAAWLARIDRAEHLALVPEENVLFVSQHRSELESILPEAFQTNPFDAISDPLEEWGTPFEELPETAHDDQLTWQRREAIIGRDPPETEPLEPVSLPVPSDTVDEPGSDSSAAGR